MCGLCSEMECGPRQHLACQRQRCVDCCTSVHRLSAVGTSVHGQLRVCLCSQTLLECGCIQTQHCSIVVWYVMSTNRSTCDRLHACMRECVKVRSTHVTTVLTCKNRWPESVFFGRDMCDCVMA
jgi:hypothetical protein